MISDSGTDELDVNLARSSLEKIFAATGAADASEELERFGLNELIEAAGPTAVRLAFHAQGRAGATSRALHEVMLSALGEPLTSRTEASVLLPMSPTSWDGVSGRDVGERTQVSGIVLGGLKESVVFAVRNATGDVVVRQCQAADMSGIASPAPGLDQRLAITQIRGAMPAAQWDRSASGADWNRATLIGRLALAAELTGCAETMLDLAVSHGLSRKQFGVPVGSFQAVKHKLADLAVAIEGADVALDAAVSSSSTLSSLTAKSLAGTAGRLAMKHCLQVLGGIGFTWEHPYHHLHRRVMILDRLLGSASDLPSVIGRELLATGRVPTSINIA